jgi:hypothetical protein
MLSRACASGSTRAALNPASWRCGVTPLALRPIG